MGDVQTPQNLMSKTTSSGPMGWRSTARGANESKLELAACWREEKRAAWLAMVE